MKRILMILPLLFGILPAEPSAYNETLLDVLHADDGWREIKNVNGAVMFHKDISDMDLAAIMVAREVDLSADTLIRIFEDVNNYPEVLQSAASIDFRTIDQRDEYVDAYQHIDIPIIKDRHYVYRLNRNRSASTDTVLRSDWKLFSKDGSYRNFVEQMEQEKGRPVYLDYGAGSFVVETLPNGKARASYRLYMDPGGRLPEFIVQMINEYGIVQLFDDVINEAQRREVN